ncbi:hypothetical protein [Pontibacter litorisediminis]|uniref:hypothetical protein n=1 Tax=Pontibacter litorisediminis TaxID=1846260 RepID=UPI0023EDDFB7|nr:hypothetical protein [Pontibacter litorisediminis]
MEERKKDQAGNAEKKNDNPGEDKGKGSSPGATGYITGGENWSTRPEQGPDVPPEERTTGIP